MQRERSGGGGGGRGKLSLRRKRALEEEGGGEAREGARTCANISSWFGEEGSSNAEGAWRTLLRALEPHLDLSSFDEAVHLPPFLPKSSQTASPQAKPEAFNAGTKEFQWFPFPLYQREGTKGNHSRRHQNSEKETAGLIESAKYEGERPKVISSAPEQKSSTASEHTSEVSQMNFSIKSSTQLDRGEGFETCQHVPRQNSPGHSSFAQSHLKECEQRWKRCSLRDGVESKRENGRENPSNKDALGQGNEATSTSPLRDHHSASFSGQRKTEENRSKDIPTLEKCPLCQMCFPGTWSGLDIDSHLTKCLSESADDVVW